MRKYVESFLRDYREFWRDYREYFGKVKRDYKSRVNIFQGYLDFELSTKKFDYREFFESEERTPKEN